MKKCIYLTEGECEEKLIRALQERPSLVLPGKVKKFNVIQNELPVSLLMQFDPGSIVVLMIVKMLERLGAPAHNSAAKACL